MVCHMGAIGGEVKSLALAIAELYNILGPQSREGKWMQQLS
jgi:hypothetical protein